MRIGLDVMGGDYAPQNIVLGAIGAYSILQPGNVLYLFGDQSEITGICHENDFDPGNFVIVHCSQTKKIDSRCGVKYRQ